jgi:hypothetical protein
MMFTPRTLGSSLSLQGHFSPLVRLHFRINYFVYYDDYRGNKINGFLEVLSKYPPRKTLKLLVSLLRAPIDFVLR